MNCRPKRGHTNEILTAYGVQEPIEMGDEVHRGKADFLREHYGDLFDSGVLSRFNGVSKGYQKRFYAEPNTVLLDDWGKNITGFRAAGGLAVHYKHDEHDQCVAQLLAEVGLDTW